MYRKVKQNAVIVGLAVALSAIGFIGGQFLYVSQTNAQGFGQGTPPETLILVGQISSGSIRLNSCSSSNDDDCATIRGQTTDFGEAIAVAQNIGYQKAEGLIVGGGVFVMHMEGMAGGLIGSP